MRIRWYKPARLYGWSQFNTRHERALREAQFQLHISFHHEMYSLRGWGAREPLPTPQHFSAWIVIQLPLEGGQQCLVPGCGATEDGSPWRTGKIEPPEGMGAREAECSHFGPEWRWGCTPGSVSPGTYPPPPLQESAVPVGSWRSCPNSSRGPAAGEHEATRMVLLRWMWTSTNRVEGNCLQSDRDRQRLEWLVT